MSAFLIALFTALVAPAHAQDQCKATVPPPAVVTDMNAVVGTVRATGPSAQNTQVRLGSLFRSGPNTTALARVLRGVANEPGEKGWVGFDLSAGGKIGTGAINGSVEGSAGLEVAYQVSDENRVVMGMDWEAALKAGVSFAGIVEFGGKVEAGGSVVKVSFPTSHDAAAWLTTQLNTINKGTGYRLYPRGSRAPSYASPTGISDRWVAAGAYVDAGAGGYGFNGELKGKREYRTFNTRINGKRAEITSITDHLIGTAKFSVPFGGDNASVSYTYDEAQVSGSPFYFANGTGSDHTVQIRVPLAAFKKKFNETPGEPSKAVQDLVVDTFAKIETLAPGATLKGLNYKAFNAVTKEIYEQANSSNSRYAKAYVTLTARWNFVDDPNGERNMTYARLYLGGEAVGGVDFNVKAARVSAQLSAGKTELIYEALGTRTISYIQRQFVYQTADRPWSKFVRENRAVLEKLVAGVANDPSHPYYDSSLKGLRFDDALRRLTDKWKREDKMIERGKAKAIGIASDSHRWQSFFQTDNIQRDIASKLESISNTQARQYVWSLVDDFGGDYDRILDIANGKTPDGVRLSNAIWSAMTPEQRAAWTIRQQSYRITTQSRGMTWKRSSTNKAAATSINQTLQPFTKAQRQEIMDTAASYGAHINKIRTITSRTGYSSVTQFSTLRGSLSGLRY